MSKPQTFDTIVIGAGIIGSGCAYKIAKSGQKTLLLEQFSLGHAHGSSHGASRIIRCTHGEPHILPFALDAFKEWEELEKIDRNAGKALIIKNGVLTIDCDWKRTLEKSDILRSFNVPHEILYGGSIIQRRFPQFVNFDKNYSAIYEPGGGALLANNCLEAVQRQFQALGSLATLKDNEKVLSIDSIPQKEDGFSLLEVATNKGTCYYANNVVVATGGWLPNLLPNIPVLPHRVGVCFWKVLSRPELFKPENGTAPSFVIIEENGQIYYSLPCIDYPNAIKLALHGWDLPITKMDDHVFGDKTKISDWTEISQYISKHFPDLDSSSPMLKYACVYNLTEDENFIVDRHPKIPNLFIAGGFSGTGFKHALTIGKIISNWINGKNVDFDMEKFKIDRKTNVLMKARI
uniref:Sarcosine oxidasee (formaldehyde-forming) n=1 Tax=Meloidogyne incognita TaxID=6306 RepID=A0A914NHK0_MELIC